LPSMTLTNGDSICTILPEIGGGLSNWRIGDQDMFRCATQSAMAARDPLGLATFPLVPFSNRIGNGMFDWNGETIAIEKNFAPEPHAIHGVGWKRAWRVERHSDSSVTLILSHSPDANWPWAFEARQVVTLDKTGLTLALSARNLSAQAVPLAFGHHPYFDVAGATMAFAAERMWTTGSDGLPSGTVKPDGQFDFSLPQPVKGRDIDHCYAGIAGRARITWSGRRFALEVTSTPPMAAAVVYIPKGGDAFCFEPVPHITNALNLPDHVPAMPVVGAGAQFEAKIVFDAIAL
jgi:aldose 1-epimerase